MCQGWVLLSFFMWVSLSAEQVLGSTEPAVQEIKEEDFSLENQELHEPDLSEQSLSEGNLNDIDQIEEMMHENDHRPKLSEEIVPPEPDVFKGVIDYLEAEENIIEQEKKLKQDQNSKNFSEKIRDLHTSLSDDIVSIADGIDSFFINKNIVEGRNRTNIRLTNTTNIVEYSGLNNDFDFKLRLRLPQLKRRIQIEFEDDSLSDDTASGRDNLSQNRTLKSNQQGGSRGGLSYYQKLLGFESKLSSGIELRNKVILFAKFRLSKDFVLNENQKITFIHDVFDDTRGNRGQLGILNYDYTFNKYFLFRLLNEETYRDINNTFQTTHGLSLYHQISDRNFLSYNYRLESLNPEARSVFYLNTHIVNVSFRRRLYREHLFYEMGPALIFPKAHQFEALPAFTFKLELIFGNI